MTNETGATGPIDPISAAAERSTAIPRIVHLADPMVVFLRTYLPMNTLDPALGT